MSMHTQVHSCRKESPKDSHPVGQLLILQAGHLHNPTIIIRWIVNHKFPTIIYLSVWLPHIMQKTLKRNIVLHAKRTLSITNERYLTKHWEPFRFHPIIFHFCPFIVLLVLQRIHLFCSPSEYRMCSATQKDCRVHPHVQYHSGMNGFIFHFRISNFRLHHLQTPSGPTRLPLGSIHSSGVLITSSTRFSSFIVGRAAATTGPSPFKLPPCLHQPSCMPWAHITLAIATRWHQPVLHTTFLNRDSCDFRSMPIALELHSLWERHLRTLWLQNLQDVCSSFPVYIAYYYIHKYVPEHMVHPYIHLDIRYHCYFLS